MKKLSLIILLVSSVILINAQNVDTNQTQVQTQEQVQRDSIRYSIENDENQDNQDSDTTETKKKSKGAFYITVGGGVGPTGLHYDLKSLLYEGDNKLKLGGNALVGVSYFFNKTIGIGSGVGVGYFRSSGTYKGDFDQNKYIGLGNQLSDNVDNPDNIDRNYELRARLQNWEEIQTSLYLEIPLLFQIQHKFGAKQKVGLYFNVGVKFQIPLTAKYEVIDGNLEEDQRLNVSGYSPATGSDWGTPGHATLVDHGFGSIHNPNEALDWNAKMKLKFSMAATGEFGFLFALGRRVDLNLGAFIDYGFLNVKKETADLALLEAPQSYQPDANGNIGNGIIYNGMINSNRVDKAKLLSYGGKIGVRIRLGKIEATPQEKEEEMEQKRNEEQKEFNEAILDALKDLKKGLDEILTWKDMIDDRLNQPVNATVAPAYDDYLQGMQMEEYDTLMGHTYFTLNSSVVRPSQYPLLDYKVMILKKYPHVRLQIYGNTCDLGSEKLNTNLGLSRAMACRDYLISKGIPAYRIIVSTQSFNKPMYPNTSDENRAKNRRCDYEIFAPK